MVALILMVMMLTPAFSSDVIINAKVQSVTKAVDKNGNTYIRFIVNETRKLQGTEYTAGVAIMAFREHVEQLSSISDGDTLKAICAEREYKGKKSYTILKVLP